jgi:trigger factor
MTDETRPEGSEAPAVESGVATEAASAPGSEEQPTGAKLRQQVDITDAGPCRKHIRVIVDREDIDSRFKDHYSKLVTDAAVPGYRPGKAPRKLIEKRFKADVSDQVKSEVLMASLEQIGEDHDVAPLAPPNLQLDKILIPESGPMIYEFEVEVRPTFDLPPYRGIKLMRPVKDVTDDEVKKMVRRLLRPHGQIVPKEGGVVEEGDVIIAEVVIQDEGSEVGRISESMFEVERELSFKDGMARRFLEQVQGARAGDRREVDIELSSRAARSMGGKSVKGLFDIKDVKSIRLPELAEEFLQEMFGVSNEGQLEELARSAIQRSYEHMQRRAARSQILKLIAASGTWDLPRDLLLRQTRKAIARRVLEMRGDGVPEQQIDEEIRRMQQDILSSTALALKEHFVLQKIAEVEKIEVDDDDIAEEIDRMADQTGESPRKVRARLEKEDMMDALAAEMIERKALDLILDNAEYEDVSWETYGASISSQASADVQAVPGEMADPAAEPSEAPSAQA